MNNDPKNLQVAYDRECAIIGEAYTVIREQRKILKAATIRRSQVLSAYQAQKTGPVVATPHATENTDDGN